MELAEFKKIFDPVLEDFLENRINEFSKNTSDAFIKDFISYSKTLTLTGGKRVRPYIAYVMYVANGGKDIENAIRLFISLEIFHMFALIHDDIMDKQNKRHGVDTIHAYVLKKLKEQKRTGDIENVARAQGILLGDLFFSWAMEIFLDNRSFLPENISKAHDYFYKMVDEVCLGQILDIDTTTRESALEELINEKTRLKTSRYTFVRPMQIGAHLANPENNLDQYSESLGTKLGIAFQIQDDLFDLTLTPDKKYKTVLSDMRTHQQTIFTQFILDSGSKKNKSELLALWGSDLTPADRPRVINLFKSSGALSYGIQEMNTNFEEALSVLEASQLPRKYKIELRELVNTIRNRTS